MIKCPNCGEDIVIWTYEEECDDEGRTFDVEYSICNNYGYPL